MDEQKKGRKQTSVESISLTNLKKGSSFYTHKGDRAITAIACYYDKKVSTERLITVNPNTAETQRIVKVTIL